MTDDEFLDPAVSGVDGPKRPTGTQRPLATFQIPEPDGSGLQRAKMGGARSEPEPANASSAPSIDDYAERRRRDSSYRFAPLPRLAQAGETSQLDAIALIEERVALWTEIAANWRSLQDDDFRHDLPGHVEDALRAGHDMAAKGLTLALASEVCVKAPSPENRQMLAELSPRYPDSGQRVAAILDLPADQLPAALIDHLARYEQHALGQKQDREHAIAPAFERDQVDNQETAPRAPDIANDNAMTASSPALDAHSPAEASAQEDTLARGDEDANGPAPGAGAETSPASRAGEFDWREMATEAVVQLHREAAEAQHVRTPEPALTEHEQAEATREQSDAKRERQAHDFRRVAREVVADARRAPERGRDEEGGREL